MGALRSKALLALLLSLFGVANANVSIPSARAPQPLRSGLQRLFCRAPALPTAAVSDAACDFPTVNRANNAFFLPLFENLTATPFFRYFRVNLDQTCPFWEDDGYCMVRDCSVCECDPKEVPLPWLEQDGQALRSQDDNYAMTPLDEDPFGVKELGSCLEQRRVEAWRADQSSQLEADITGERLGRVDRSEAGDDELHDLMAADWRPTTSWVHDDDLVDPEAAYINLLQNHERFTGYGGPHAHRIWRCIYDENCFMGGTTRAPECLEKRVFHRIISGFQSSITTHIALDFFHEDTGAWGTNVDLLTKRVLNFKDRTDNLYFLYLFLLRAITKAGPTLVAQNFTTGYPMEDSLTLDLVQRLVSASNAQGAELSPSFGADDVPQCCHGFDETAMFAGWGPSGEFAKPAVAPANWWDERSEHARLRLQLQHKFQNISRVMDCVGCEKCRLWGKLQILGIGTAFKVLFGDLSDVDLNRNEVIALVNTAHQVAMSIAFVEAARDVEIIEKLQKVRRGADAPTIMRWLGVGLAWGAFVFIASRLLKRRKKKKKKKTA